MKTATCFLFCLFFLIKSGDCQYTVTKVVGNVLNKKTGVKISSGSRLIEDDILQWREPFTPNDMIRVIAPGRGTLVITPGPKAKKNQSEILDYVKTHLKIKPKDGSLSGRASNDEYIPGSLETETKINSRVLIFPVNHYLFDKREYDISDGSRFFLQIKSAGAKPVIRQLKTIDDTLFIPASDFYLYPDPNWPSVKYQLGFFSKTKSATKSLIEIKPTFDTTGLMKMIIKEMIINVKENNKMKLREACYKEIYIALGKPSDIDFDEGFEDVYSALLKASTKAPQKNNYGFVNSTLTPL